MKGYQHGMYAKVLATISKGKARSPGGRGPGPHYVIVYYNDCPTKVRVRPGEVGVVHSSVIRQA